MTWTLIFGLIPILVILLIVYIIIKVMMHKNKGEIDYGNSYLNILDNDTTEDEDENEGNEENEVKRP